jgi:DNA adenine methylase
MLFYILQKYSIKNSIINDINPDLATCYRMVRDCPLELIDTLYELQNDFYELKTEEERRNFFLNKRDDFNSKLENDIKNSALFIFLNKTCFNGLYRVNKSGKFNVPYGKYINPVICDRETILVDSKLLQNVQIYNGDFGEIDGKFCKGTFFYLDPPYRPISETSTFTSYTKEGFGDDSQLRLKSFCDKLNDSGANFLMSNSDSGDYFDKLFYNYNISKVACSRAINSNPNKRGKLTEILIKNYN